jgi:putative addiction module CopG family antidote
MAIFLHPDIELYVREQVSRGAYRSADEVVTEALYLLYLRDQAASEEREASQTARAA